MKLLHLVGLSIVGMTFASAGVWALTPPAEAGASAPQPVATSPVLQQAVAAAQPVMTQDGTLQLEARLGHARVEAQSPASTFVHVEVRGPATAPSLPKQPLNLAIVLDRSGSMKGERLQNALRAARGMIQQLRDGDVVSVVAYHTTVEPLVSSTTIDGSSRARVLAALDNIEASGDTCISCGLETGMSLLQRRNGMVNRMLLLSDGEARLGVTDVAGFQRIGERSRRMGCSISSIGLDVDYNEQTLLALASTTNGRHHFAEQARDLQKVFSTELASLQSTVAKGTEVELKLAPGVRLKRVLDRSFRREGDRVFVALGPIATTETRTVLAEVELPASATGVRPVSEVRISYTDLMKGGAAEAKANLSTLAGVSAAQLDPVVAARLARTGTADMLDEARELFKNSDVQNARRKLELKIGELKRQRAVAAKTPAAPRVTRDLDNQLKDLEETSVEFDDAQVDAPEPEAAPKSRVGKSSQKKAADRSFSNRL